MMNSYLKFKETRQKEVDNFPILFAFSKKQFEDGLIKFNTTEKNIISIGGGGFIKKSDKKAFNDLFEKHENNFKEYLKNDDFVYNMFLYELADHEYCITYDYTDTLDSLNITMEQIKENKRLFELLKKAKKDYLKDIQW